jgi:hypothetical protein
MMGVRSIKFKPSAVLAETDTAVLCGSGRSTFPWSPPRAVMPSYKAALRTATYPLSQLEYP